MSGQGREGREGRARHVDHGRRHRPHTGVFPPRLFHDFSLLVHSFPNETRDNTSRHGRRRRARAGSSPPVSLFRFRLTGSTPSGQSRFVALIFRTGLRSSFQLPSSTPLFPCTPPRATLTTAARSVVRFPNGPPVSLFRPRLTPPRTSASNPILPAQNPLPILSPLCAVPPS